MKSEVRSQWFDKLTNQSEVAIITFAPRLQISDFERYDNSLFLFEEKMMFKSQVQILQSVLSAQQKPTLTDGDFVIFRVEDLPCRPSTAIKAIGYKSSEQELYIQWQSNNETRRYFRVPFEIWSQFRTCTSSIGKLYHQIRKEGNLNFGSSSCDNLID